jgi:hypothetical protein
MLGLVSSILLVLSFCLLSWGVVVMHWSDKHPPTLTGARDWKTTWGNFHGRLGWILFFTLQMTFYASWMERGFVEPFQMQMLWGLVLPLLLALIWAAPDGVYLQEEDGVQWFSNGRSLSVHLAKDKAWAVNREELKARAAQLLGTIQTTGLPLRISTPLNINPLIRILRRQPNILVTKGPRWPLAILWLPLVARRRRNRSGLSWWLAIKKSIISQTWIITPAPASE